MTTSTLKDYLEREHVKYQAIRHMPAYTAQETAQSAHIQAEEFAKTVMVRMDGKLAMAVVPASRKLDLESLKQATGAKEVALAAEPEFETRFPGCEPGAMPPFGNLYGLEVFVEKALAAGGKIAFNAGSHAELIRMAYRDFDRLAQPKVVKLSHDAGQPGRAPRSGPPVHPKLHLIPAAVAILDVLEQGGQAACSAAELRSLIHHPAREIEAGIAELEQQELLRIAFTTPEDQGYELTAAGKDYVSTRLHTSGL